MSGKKDKLISSSMASGTNKGPANKLRGAPSAFYQNNVPGAGSVPVSPGGEGSTPSVAEEIPPKEPSPVPMSKSEKFLTFLQGNGVRMAFVRTLVALYEEDEKPDEPLPFICDLMGRGLPTKEDVLAKQEELNQLRFQYLAKQDENQILKYRLSKYITPEDDEEEGEEDFGFQFEYDPNNYNYLNNKRLSDEEEAGRDGDDEETVATRGDEK